MKMQKNQRTKILVTLSMLTAVAFIMGALIRVRGIMPGAAFLTYDAKDVGILLGGFIFGPAAALLMSVVLALLEMVTISDSGPIGALMNMITSASFTCTAAFVYKKTRSLKGAVAGLALGTVAVTAVALMWNYVMIPIYQPWISRQMVANLILPALLPFNLIKSVLNAALAMMLYRHVRFALDKARLIPRVDDSQTDDGAVSSKKKNNAVLFVSVFVIVTIVVILLALRGIL